MNYLMLCHLRVCLIENYDLFDFVFTFKEIKSRHLPGADSHSPQAFEPKVEFSR